MTEKYLMGVDLGTTGTKATLFRSDGVAVAEASAEVPLHYPKPGVVEQENDDFYTTAAQTVKQCITESGIDPRTVAAVAFDSQMAGVGSIDEHYQPATRFDSWLDMRCQPYIELLEREHGDLITQTTGCPPTCDHGPKILWWKEECPADYARIAKFIMPTAYVVGRMAELKADEAFIDYTYLHFSGLSDARAGAWSDTLCGLLGVDKTKLPRIVNPWEVVGEVRDAAAKDFGLAPGTPLVAGAGDTAAGALGAGIVRPGMLFDTAGTASALAGATDQFAPDVKHRALLMMRSVVPGLWNPLAYIGGGGLALNWFRDEFFNVLRGDKQPAQSDLFLQMTEAAKDIPPGAEGLFFSPHLGGRICPANPAMRGTWVGFSWGHTQAHFFRAILESIAFEYAYYLNILRELIPELELFEARVIGGGARSAVWNEIKANVLGVPYQRLKRSEFGAWGCALIAGYGVGLFDNLAEAAARGAEPDGAAIPPQPELHATYRKLVENYIAWQAIFSDSFRNLQLSQDEE